MKALIVLFSSYRLDQYADPEGFKANMGMVLEQYPIDTIRFVTDPRTGVQRRCSFPPTVKEMVDACDQHLQHKAKMERYQNWGKGEGSIGGMKPSGQLPPPREQRPTYDELKAKYGENWGIDSSGGASAPKRFDWDAAVERTKAQMQLNEKRLRKCG